MVSVLGGFLTVYLVVVTDNAILGMTINLGQSINSLAKSLPIILYADIS
jgi:hypothetical protein